MRRGIIALCVLGALCYAGTWGNPFVHDDIAFILQNPKVHDLSHLADVFYGSSITPAGIIVANAYYRPFLDIVYRLEYFCFGPVPGGYHMVNLAIHLGNVFLLYFLAMRFTRRQGLSWCVAALFLVHPIQSEAVACISGISNLLFTFFLLASFLLYLKIADRGLELTWAEEAGAYSGALFLFACALLAKEQAIVLPVLLLLYEYCFPNLDEKDKAVWRLRMAGFVIVAGGYLLWRKMIFGGFTASFVSNWGEFYLRLKAFPAMIMEYIQTIFVPTGLHYYRSHDILSPWVIPALSFLLFLTVVILIGKVMPQKSRSVYVFGLGWFAVTILPTTSLMPLFHEYSFIAAFEHFVYLPLAGFLLSLALVLDYFFDRWFGEGGLSAKRRFMFPFVIVLTVLTFQQTCFWSSEVALFGQAVHYESRMGRLHLLFAKAIINSSECPDVMKYKMAKYEFATARNIMAGYLGKVRDQRVRPFYEGFLRDSLLGLASCSEATHNYRDAVIYYQQILKLTPADTAVWNNLGVIAVRAGQFDQAVVNFKKALDIDPVFVPARVNLEHLLQQRK